MKSEIQRLCERFGVKRLELFGSAATGEFDEQSSDFDFLVDFELTKNLTALDAYFGLKEALESLLGKPVDLVMPSALRNPYFLAMIEQQRQPLYEA